MFKYIDIHTHKISRGDIISLPSYSIGIDAAPPGSGLFSAGIHPWSVAKTYMEQALDYLRTAPISAVGEIGLDYSIDNLDSELQVTVFKEQLYIAKTRNLPVILHCVKAYNDALAILKEYDLKAVIFHGYIGSPQQTKQITDKGYYISVGEVSLQSPKTISALRQCPLEKVFAETDTTETGIKDIYIRLAEILAVNEQELAGIIYKNYQKIFG